MKKFTVTYNGNSSRFKGISEEVTAISARQAVEDFYQSKCEDNYFPQSNGSILDMEGDTICDDSSDDRIFFDGGYFTALEHYGLQKEGRQLADNYVDVCYILFGEKFDDPDFKIDRNHKAFGYTIIDDIGREHAFEYSSELFYDALESLV